MNDTLKTALATAVTAATEALEAAQQDRFTEARELLSIVAEQLALGEGGNAAAAARRKKILRLQAETQALIDAAPVETELVEAAPVEPEPTEEAQVEAPVNLPLLTPLPPVADAAAELADKAPRKAAAPIYLTPEAWGRVALALRAQGIDAGEQDAVADEHDAAAEYASIERNTYAAKVAQRVALLDRVQAAALRGEVDVANTAWDRLFDVVTALRISELNARRKGADEVEQAEKLANYTAAREDSLRIRQWARSVQAA
ncbi:hypothetical protein EHF33_13840 [Deinococcus psychrotolerans]|uniref:Uncharacterized protein n=1 Tax=Deinococcus psychrotolerans TaxID=2489213 RepID=A0A3G8YN13_9DEIO|nr:hypothetical protein [Deinococcus psychrotolerans]AZI44004.1 hypothetical protein EHF33_13840 [Deinococcus psychrotolerans]